MAGTTANVLVGGASQVALATYISAKVVSLTYTDIGYTMGGVTVDPKVELYNIETDQTLGVIAAVPKKRDMEIKLRMAEVHSENVLYALGLPSSSLTTNGSTNSTLGLTASAIETYYQMKIVGKGTRGGGVRTCTFWKVLTKDLGTLLFKKDDVQGPEVTFQVCEDTSGTNTTATYGMIVDT